MPCILAYMGWSSAVPCCPANSFSLGDVRMWMQCAVFMTFFNVSAL